MSSYHHKCCKALSCCKICQSLLEGDIALLSKPHQGNNSNTKHITIKGSPKCRLRLKRLKTENYFNSLLQ